MTLRFDADRHEYSDGTGRIYPHITWMLKQAGWVDDQWFTDASRDRGTAVHKLTTEYDLGAIDDPASVRSPHKAYLLAYVEAMAVIRPEILDIEVPIIHRGDGYGCRPDRVVRIDGILGVLELKSGAASKAHPIQTALQAEAVAWDRKVGNGTALGRWCLYLMPTGRWKLTPHLDPADHLHAAAVKRRCLPVAGGRHSGAVG